MEVASGYTLLHGEAVAVGLVAEARLAEALDVAGQGVALRIQRALRGLGLPVEVPDQITPESLLRAMSADKKRAAGTVRFTLPAAIGDVRTGIEVRDLLAALTSCSALSPPNASVAAPPPTTSAPTATRQRRGERG